VFAAGSSQFNVEGAPLAQDSFVGSANIAVKLSDSMTADLSYSGQIASHMTDRAVNADVTFVW
jgi:uncharacterized protein with beta-barrel porin domain